MAWYVSNHGTFAVLTSPGSIFYIGYLIAQWPAGFALQKLPMGKFLSITTISTSFCSLYCPIANISSMGRSANDHTGMSQFRRHRRQPLSPRLHRSGRQPGIRPDDEHVVYNKGAAPSPGSMVLHERDRNDVRGVSCPLSVQHTSY